MDIKNLKLASVLWVVMTLVLDKQALAFDAERLSATVFNPARSISDFRLTDDEGKVFTNQDLKEHWSLLFFGFTHCGYVCPTTMALLNQVVGKLKQSVPQVMLISIDPTRDDVSTIHRYVTRFNPHFRGARGAEDIIDKMSRNFNVLYEKSTDKNGDDINHSGVIYVVNPRGELAALFNTPLDADTVASEYKLISKNYSTMQ